MEYHYIVLVFLYSDFIHLFSQSLQQLLLLLHKMAKRNIEGSSKGNEFKFELERGDTSILYAVVSKFMGESYIHIRKYYNEKPTTYGVCFKLEAWYDFVPYLTQDTKEKYTDGSIQVEKLANNVVRCVSLKTDMDIFIRKPAMDILYAR